MPVEIVGYSKVFDRTRFACGKPDLDDWLKTQASQQERSGNTRTFLAIADDERVVGYYSTTTYRLDLEDAARAYGIGSRQYPVPAVLLARLAVDSGNQGTGLGAELLIHALAQFADASRSVGFEAVVVHAIDEDAVTFYARFGFTRFMDHSLHLFMPVKNLLATFAATARNS